MVKVMIELVKNLSPLRIEAPEWYPGSIREKEEDDEVGDKTRNYGNKGQFINDRCNTGDKVNKEVKEAY